VEIRLVVEQSPGRFFCFIAIRRFLSVPLRPSLIF
jgi:hypothetical protein